MKFNVQQFVKRILVLIVLFCGVSMAPLGQRLHANQAVLQHLSEYREGVFIVEKGVDYGVKRGATYASQTYLLGSIGDHHNLTYSDGEVYPLGEIDRKYPKGTQIKVLYNFNQPKHNGGLTPQVISYKDNPVAKYQKMVGFYTYLTYGPFGVSLSLLTLLVVTEKRNGRLLNSK